MARMTKAQRGQLEAALYHAKRALAYIDRDNIAVCLKGDKATTTLHYTREDGSSLYPLCKDIGSDLCGLQDAVRILQNILTNEYAERLN